MNRVHLLGSISLFEGLSDGDLEPLARELEEVALPAGTVVFQKGDEGADLYVVADGQVNIFLPGELSKRVSLKDIGRGEYFGELALFDDKPRSASALATTDTILLKLPRATLWAYLEQYPRAAIIVLRTMAQRLRETNEMLSARVARNAIEEVERNLSWSDRLADKVAALNGSWTFILSLGGVTVSWFLLNSRNGFGAPFDPYPYVFFNLVLAIVVSLQGPLIVMSQNRQVLKDRATAQNDFKVNLKNEVNIESILRELGEFREEAGDRLSALEARTRESDGRSLPPL